MIAEPLLLTQSEIRDLTGLQQPAAQVARLKTLGYWMARRTPMGVALPRAHYVAVCSGARPPDAIPANTTSAARPQVRTMAMRRAAA